MSQISGVSGGAQTQALLGIHRALGRLDQDAAVVARGSFGGDTVSLSSDARAKASGSTGDLDTIDALVDTQTEKAAVAANVKVLHVSDELSKDLLKLGSPSEPR